MDCLKTRDKKWKQELSPFRITSTLTQRRECEETAKSLSISFMPVELLESITTGHPGAFRISSPCAAGTCLALTVKESQEIPVEFQELPEVLQLLQDYLSISHCKNTVVHVTYLSFHHFN